MSLCVQGSNFVRFLFLIRLIGGDEKVAVSRDPLEVIIPRGGEAVSANYAGNMTSNGGYQLPQMASSGQDLANMVESVADAIDRHMEAIFVSVRSTLESSQWVPDAIKPPQRPTPTPIPLSVLQRGQKWADENRAITAAICAFVGTGAFLAWRRRRMSRLRRKARKGSQGNRTEAVVLAGSPHSLLTRSLAQDLEKRGFIVFVVTDTLADEQVVRGEGKTDIHPLNLDLSSVCRADRASMILH